MTNDMSFWGCKTNDGKMGFFRAVPELILNKIHCHLKKNYCAIFLLLKASSKKCAKGLRLYAFQGSLCF